MVSEICEINDKEVNTKFLVTDDNLFCADGYLREPGIIENIAQSAAAMNGYNSVKNNLDVARGFIGSVNDLHIYSLPESGKEIETSVVIENKVLNVQIIRGVVSQDEKVMAECKMKIFLEE